ncbi:MAG: hypothetical protein KDD66_08765 [Bdellovibrionales bacterium]|nr:hypothetical protein [Bdellovibrionales bacterium]
MKQIYLLLILLIAASPAEAMVKYYQGYNFEAFVECTSGRRPIWNWKKSYHDAALDVREGEEYSIYVRNPLPVRVAVVVTVDGLNTIDGEKTHSDRGSKWMIQPYSTIKIDGWQTGDSTQRKFVFTRPQFSYARWREDRDGRNYTDKLGEIKIAYFWNSNELRDALSWRRQYWNYEKRSPYASGIEGSADSAMGAPEYYGGRAGTGMGRYDHNPVRMVDFHYDTGMYSEYSALKITYHFSSIAYDYPHYLEPVPVPMPQRRYAPEMP